MPGTELNRRQTIFVHEYLKDSNGSRAAIAAGYSPAAAAQIASRLLTKANIQVALQQNLSKSEVSVARVLKEYAAIAFLNPQSLYDESGRLLSVKEMPEESARAIAGIEEEQLITDGEVIGRLKKIRLAGKVPALEGLARHLGMFQDTANVMQAFSIHIHVGDDKE